MQPKKSEGLTNLQVEQKFNKLFQDEANTNCFECGKSSKQWAETKHGIFLCQDCSKIYKQNSKSVNVKNIEFGEWKQRQIKQLERGGNKKFKQYLQFYNLVGAEPKVLLRSKAAEFYRRQLRAQTKGQQFKEEKPSAEEGQKVAVAEVPLSEMTSDQMLTEAKQKLIWAGGRTSHYGKKAYETVHHKITSGEIKEDAKSAAQTVSKTAKNIWSMIAKKVEQIQKPKSPKPADL